MRCHATGRGRYLWFEHKLPLAFLRTRQVGALPVINKPTTGFDKGMSKQALCRQPGWLSVFYCITVSVPIVFTTPASCLNVKKPADFLNVWIRNAEWTVDKGAGGQDFGTLRSSLRRIVQLRRILRHVASFRRQSSKLSKASRVAQARSRFGGVRCFQGQILGILHLLHDPFQGLKPKAKRHFRRCRTGLWFPVGSHC